MGWRPMTTTVDAYIGPPRLDWHAGIRHELDAVNHEASPGLAASMHYASPTTATAADPRAPSVAKAAVSLTVFRRETVTILDGLLAGGPPERETLTLRGDRGDAYEFLARLVLASVSALHLRATTRAMPRWQGQKQKAAARRVIGDPGTAIQSYAPRTTRAPALAPRLAPMWPPRAKRTTATYVNLDQRRYANRGKHWPHSATTSPCLTGRFTRLGGNHAAAAVNGYARGNDPKAMTWSCYDGCPIGRSVAVKPGSSTGPAHPATVRRSISWITRSSSIALAGDHVAGKASRPSRDSIPARVSAYSLWSTAGMG